MYIKRKSFKNLNGVFRFEKFKKRESYLPINVLEMIILKKSLTTGGSLGRLNPHLGDEGV